MKIKTRQLTMMGVMCAMALVLTTVCKFSLVTAAPYLKYEPKDVIITIGGFIFGPLSALAMSAVVALTEMLTISDTGPIGCIMNFLAAASFSCTAAIIYKRFHTQKGAIWGLSLAVVALAAVMLLWNYLITPLYTGFHRADIAKMLIPIFLPFNLIKGILNASITAILYKPTVMGLRRMNIIPQTAAPKKINIGVVLLALFVIALCIAFVWQML